MKYSYNWLKELSGTQCSAEQLKDKIMLHAFEVEGLEKLGDGLDKVVVGEILQITPHPNADKLQCTKVNVGVEILDIVCGAKNIEVGQKVPVAMVGAKLPIGIEIKEAEIRGVQSKGMICAQDEMGLGTDHDGIMVLSSDAEIGKPFKEYLGLDDTIVEVDILANRAHDALSHVGMAREIAAIEGQKMEYDYEALKLNAKEAHDLSIKIDSDKVAQRYIGALIQNLTIADSPLWMQNRLRNCGLRPINALVDITNYVMLELGQPMHAFDADYIGKEIIVRNANEGEKIEILDETERILTSEDIVIANNNGAIAIAGVMGGKDTGIKNETRNIILESATFTPASIRRTRMRHGLFTDAALRFEKGLDPNLAEKAMARAIELTLEICGGNLAGVKDVYLQNVESWKIELPEKNISKLLGIEISREKSIDILKSLGINVEEKSGILIAQIPTYRLDLQTPEDLIEEIGRIYGYENIKPQLPKAHVKSAQVDEKRSFVRILKDVLVGYGFSEMYNYSFYSANDKEVANLNEYHYALESPLSPELSLMRVSLIPNILKNVSQNLKYFKDLAIFEIGKIYLGSNVDFPTEKTMLVGAVVNEKTSRDKREDVFYETKGYVSDLLNRIGVDDFYFQPFDDVTHTIWHAGRTAHIKKIGTEEILGIIGEVHPHLLEAYSIKKRIAIFEFNVDTLNQIAQSEREFQPVRKYPTVSRDLSLIAPEGILVDQMLSLMQTAGSELLLDVDLFDIYDFEDGTTSYAFHLTFGGDRTLSSNEIDKLIENIVKELSEKLNVTLRG